MRQRNAQSVSDKRKAVIYIRVSSEEQVENFSLATQEELCRRDAKHKGYEIVDVFREEGRSAKTIIGRPELLRLLDYCRKNKKDIGAVFVYRIDRLSRQTSDYLTIRAKLAGYNISIISASEPTGNTPTEKLLETVLASFAQHDNDVRSERTKNGMKARFLAGLITNHAPIGYINQKGYAIKDPKTFDTLKKAWDLMATGTKSLNEMTNIITEWGIKMNVKSAHHLFHNKFYMGYMVSKVYPEVVKGQHIPMITEEQYYKVQSILAGRNNNTLLKPRKSRDNADFPLRVILKCGKCGTPFTGAWTKGRSAKYGYYFCRARCTNKSIAIDDADKDIKIYLKGKSPTEAGLKLYISTMVKTFRYKMSIINKRRNIADEEIEKLKALRQVIIEKNMAGIYSDEIFKEQNAAIEKKMIAAQSAKSEATLEQYNIDKLAEFIKEKLKDLSVTYDKSNLSQIRCLLGSIFLSGMIWEYPGYSNHRISPIYQDILNSGNDTITIGELLANEKELTSLQKLNKKYAEINKLATIDNVNFDYKLLNKDVILELFKREVKEKAQTNADLAIKAHFDKHRKFIESARKQIPEDYKGKNCPLCMQSLSNATSVIEFYKTAFDQTYEQEKQKFIDDIRVAKDSCEAILNSLPLLFSVISGVFDNLERIKNDYEISDIYSLDERTNCLSKFKSLPKEELEELTIKLELVKNIDRESFDSSLLYDKIDQQINDIKGSIKDFNDYLDKKNQIIILFKEKYSDQSKLTKEIDDKLQKKSELQDLITFLTANKAKLITAQNAAIAQQKAYTENLGDAQEALRTYLSTSIPKNIIDKMKIILGKFNLNFVLEHIQSTTNTKDYSFSFKIKDLKGNERKLKEGLSEGERQLISLAFFFAINENVQDKQNKILIFDDPITSLDSPNLKILAELIHKKTEEFSQVIVFTHHPLFYKYLAKCENPSAAKFGVLKNIDQFGGSFIFYDPGFDLAVEIQRCNEEITQNAKNGNLKPEEIALKYGQLLRLSVEKFIKHDLLMWNHETNFEKEIILNLSQSRSKIQKLEEDDLEVMINIYKYCNYSNLLHIDKQTPSALSELINHISKFNSILKKVNK